VVVKEEEEEEGREGGGELHVWVNGKLLVRLRRARGRGGKLHTQQQQQQQQQQQLQRYTHANLFPLSTSQKVEDERVQRVLGAVREERRRRRRRRSRKGGRKTKEGNWHANGGQEGGRGEEEEEEEEEEELGHILQYYFKGILTPAVLIIQHRHGPPSLPSSSSPSSSLASTLMIALTSSSPSSLPPLSSLPTSLGPIDVRHYRVVKSLYDGPEVPNLRDDIKKALLLHAALPRSLAPSIENGDGKEGAGTTVAASTALSSLPPSPPRVAIHLQAFTLPAQLKIRELVEDTPSMVAFSTARSALQKEGLLFVVEVGEELSPELRSRASVVLVDEEEEEEVEE